MWQSRSCPASGIMGGRFEREARAAARLSHPAIVTLYEAAVDDEGAYLVSELVRGETLDALLERGPAVRSRHRGDRASRCATRCSTRTTTASSTATSSPPTCSSPRRPPSPAQVAKLTDFGVARVVGGDALTRTGDVLGTLAYMAPEQAEGLEAAEPADLYSLALVIYEALSGVNPVAHVRARPTPRPASGMHLPPLRRQRRDLPARPGGRQSTSRCAPGRASGAPWPNCAAPCAHGPGGGRRRAGRRHRRLDPAAAPRARDGGARPRGRSATSGCGASPAARATPPRASRTTLARPTAAPALAPPRPGAAGRGRPGRLALRDRPGARARPAAGGRPARRAPRSCCCRAWAGSRSRPPLAAAAVSSTVPAQPSSSPSRSLLPLALSPAAATTWPLVGRRPGARAHRAGRRVARGGRSRRDRWRRAALGAIGWVWLLLASAIAGKALYLPPGARRVTPPPQLWMSSLPATVDHLLRPLVSSGRARARARVGARGA